MPGLVKLDIGGNAQRRDDTITIDRYLVPEGGVRADFSLGLPFKDNCVDLIYAYHVLEHVDDLVRCMEEIWRVCKHNALVYVRVPHATSTYVTWVDPHHRRGFTIETFGFFGYYPKAHFHLEYSRLRFTAPGHQSSRRRFLRTLLSKVVDTVANRSRAAQYRCERWWGQWLGFDEAFVILRADKEPWKEPAKRANKNQPAKANQGSERE